MSSQTLYRQFSKEGDLLYVGVSCRIPQRIKEHSKHSPWWDDVAKIDVEHFESRDAVLDAEKRAIQTESPKFNIHHNCSVEPDRKVECDIEGQRLVARIVSLKPIYKINEAAEVLGLRSTHQLRAEIAAGRLQVFAIPSPRTGNDVEYVSGWQLLDWLELMGARS